MDTFILSNCKSVLMILLRYVLFAVFSTIVNIVIQWISFKLYSGFLSIYIAMFFGTLAGLVLKYVLDKKYIFYYETKTIKQDSQKFVIYSLNGIWTTMIFWASELTFDKFYNAKYIGAIVGLGIGYIVKYFLDKRFVFRNVNE